MKYNDILINDRVKAYLRGEINIISENIDSNFLKDNNDQYIKDFAKISLLTEEKINKTTLTSFFGNMEVSLRNKNIKDLSFTDKQKELMVEATFSSYEYLNEKIGMDIDSFEEHLEKYLKSISKGYLGEDRNGLYNPSGAILINKDIKDENFESDKIFTLVYTHELCHCLGNDKDLKKVGLIKGKYSYLSQAFGNQDYSLLDEMETDYFAQQALKENFPKFLEYSLNYEVKLRDNDEKIEFKAISPNYYEIETYAESINYMYENTFLGMYFLNDKKINETEDTLFAEKCRNLVKSYQDFIFESSPTHKTKAAYLALENSFGELVNYYLETNDLSDKEYFKFTNKLLENPRTLSDSEVSLNQVLVAKLDIQRFNKDLEDSTKDEIKNTLEELNKPPKTVKDFGGDFLAYLGEKKSDLYDFLEDIKDVRNNKIELNHFKEKYKKLDYGNEY